MPQDQMAQVAEPAGGAPESSDQLLGNLIHLGTQREDQDENNRLLFSISQAAKQDPNVVGEAQRLGLQLGVSPDLAQRNMQIVRQMATKKQIMGANLPQVSPRLATIMQDPAFAAIALDDVPNLSSTEAIFGDVRNQFNAGAMQYEQGLLDYKQLMGTATPDEMNRANQLDMHMRALGPGRTIFGSVANFGGNVWGMAPRLATVGATGALAGAGVGALAGGAGAVPGALTGFGVGAESEFGASLYEMQAGNLYRRMLQQGISPEHAREAALAGSAVSTALQLGLMRAAGKPIGDAFDVAAQRLIGDQTAAALTKPTVSSALLATLRGYGTQAAEGSALMGGSTLASNMALNWAKSADTTAASRDVFPQPGVDQEQMWREVAESALSGAGITTLLGGLGTLLDFGSRSMDVVAARRSQAFFESLEKNAADSKVRQRNPDAYERYIAAQAEGTPAENVYIDGGKMQQVLFQHGVTPEQLDQAVPGLSAKVAEAAGTGNDVVLPTSQYAARLAGTDVGRALTEHMRMSPEAPSAAEAMEAAQAHAAWLQENGPQAMAAAFQQADEAARATPEWQQMHDEIKAQQMAAGVPDAQAEASATLEANRNLYFSKNTNYTPLEIHRMRMLNVVRGEAPGGGYTAPPLYQGAADKIGQVVADARKPGNLQSWAKYAPVSDWLRGEAANHGLKLDGFEHGIDADMVRHADREHGDAASEAQRGQIAITDEDYKRIPEVVQYPDRVIFGAKSGKKDAIIYVKKLADGSIAHVEEVRTGRKRLAAVSMYKYPAAHDVGDLADHLAHNVRNDGEHTADIIHGPSSPLFQSGADGSPASDVNRGPVRGWYRVLANGQHEIGLTPKANFSTLVHEYSHHFLNMMDRLANGEGASDQLKSDYGKIMDWLGAKDFASLTREQHETFARANELYMREGKAPTPALRGVFARVAAWMQSIYRKATQLGVEYPAHVGEIFDRMYAGEDAVDRAAAEDARPLFQNAEDAGWSEAEFERYAAENEMSVAAAKAEILRKMGEAAQREREQAWREEWWATRDAVTKQVDASREYTAIRSLREGALDDGTPLTLNRDALVKQFGEDRVKALRSRHPGLYRIEGGTDPETAAEVLGFGSAEEMMRTLESTPKRHQAIQDGTRAVLTARHGDLRYDGTLDDKAQLAVQNDQRASSLHAELLALRRKNAALTKTIADRKAAMAAITIPPLSDFRAAARDLIERKNVQDVRPDLYLNSTRKYSREAFEALRRGDAKKAEAAKHNELLNHFLYREAMEARDEVEKLEKYAAQSIRSKGIQQRLGLAGSDYRAQYNWLLARYGLGPLPAEGAPERSLQTWADEQYGELKEVAVSPAILDESRLKDYHAIPMGELRELNDAIRNMRHLAAMETTAVMRGKKMAWLEAKQAIIEATYKNNPSKREAIFESEKTRADKLKTLLSAGDAILLKPERVFEFMDGGATGPWHDYVWNPASDAQGEEYALQHEVTAKIREANDAMSPEARKRLEEKVQVPGIFDRTLARKDLISIALNFGNEGNLDRVNKTFIHNGWDPAAIDAIRNGMLSGEEWRYVQRLLDVLKPLGARMEKMEKEQTGLAPKMVKVTPMHVRTAEGEDLVLPGGYYPIDYDPRESQRGLEQETDVLKSLVGAGYQRVTTSRGYTKERTGYAGPLRFDYSHTLGGHIAKVIKDLTHREFMLQAYKLLSDVEVRKAVRETMGEKHEAQMVPWLRNIIQDRNGGTAGLNDFDKMLHATRSNLTLATLGFKLSTAALQATHAPRMLLYTSPASWGQAMVDFLGNPRQMTEQIRALSPNEMRFRGDELDRDYREKLRDLSADDRWQKKVLTASYFTVRHIDHVLSFPLWLSVMREGLAKYADLPEAEAKQKAIYEADRAVRLGLGSASAKDLAPIMRSGEISKLLTMFYGFHNGIYGQVRDLGHTFARDWSGGRRGQAVGKLTYGMTLSVLVPAVLSQMMLGQHPKDDESWGGWAARSSLLFGLDTLPLLRDIAAGMDRGGSVHFTPLEDVMEKAGHAAIAASSDKEDKDWGAIGLNALEPVLDLSGVPGAAQTMKPLRYLHRMGSGAVDDPSAWDALVGYTSK